jgi:hypothetical protein
MKNVLLSLSLVYSIGLAVYGADWYLKDMRMLEAAVANGNTHVEMRHRINTWGNVGTILLCNLMSIVAITGLSSRSNSYSQRDAN